MRDVNGNEIQVGQRAVLLTAGCGLKGKIGEVRALKDSVGALGGKRGLRITDGPEGDPNWSAWCRPDEVAVVATPTPTPETR
jgi:hypothetical protein